MTSISYKPLINSWEAYLASDLNPSLENFARYILLNTNEEKLMKQKNWLDQEMENYIEKNSTEHQFETNGPQAAILISRLSKFIRIYTKPVLQELGLTSNDEFAILTTVDARKECSKKVAINENLIELTTGIDMIKRLLKQGLLIEKPSTIDKREKLISLTDAGKSLLYTIFQKFSGIQDVLGDLNKDERNVVIKYLLNLDAFHTHVVMSIAK